MIELARRIGAGPKPPRTVVFLGFNGEERGLLGSNYYVEHPAFPLDKTIAMLNFDMVGRLGDNPLTIYGDGSHTYDFDHVADVARANILSLKAEATDAFFNIGTGLGTTIDELVGMLLEITGSGIEPEYLPQEQVFVTNRIGSTELAEQLLDFRAEVDLRAGLESVVEWRRADRAAAVTTSG